MIEGIEVLNTNKCDDVSYIFYILVVFTILSFAYMIVGIFMDAKLMAVVSFLCFIVLGTASYVVRVTTLSYHNEYQVTISDEVNFNDFNDKYEIISQEGLIYTIKEREVKHDNN